MKQHLLQGWRLSLKHFPVIIMLFLYQLLWGFFLYRAVQSVVIPLLKRYPDSMSDNSSVRLFLLEAQFQLTKTEIIEPYLWMLGGLLAARMLLTPFIQAGLAYSLHHTCDDRGTHFLRGIRRAWKPMMALYAAEMTLLLAPAWWLLPVISRLLHTSGSGEQLLLSALPYLCGWLLWGGLLHLLFRAAQFGVVARKGWHASITSALRSLLPLAAISLALLGISLLLSLVASAVSMIWAGLLALILHQAFYLIRSLLKVWAMASQYQTWQSRQSSE